MQHTFSPTSKVPIVFRSLNSLQVQSLLKLKVNFLIVSPYKTQKANYILPSTWRRIYVYIPKGRMGHSEEMLDQIKTETQQGKLLIL